MIKVINIVYHCHEEYDRPGQVLKKHLPSIGYSHYLKNLVNSQFVKHMNGEGIVNIDDTRFAFFKSKNKSWYIPFKTHRYIKLQKPDILIVEGFIYPLQVMMLRLKLGRRPRILLQYHGEKPGTGARGYLQKLADKCVDAYLFTSCGNASQWINDKIIRSSAKCRELLPASTTMYRKDKQESRDATGMKGDINFLWVGRLDTNKDPLTVLNAFEQFVSKLPSASLYMIFQDGHLLDQVKASILNSPALSAAVILVGKVPNENLPEWYSAADFFISASHQESCGYALLEAMACGCIPIVTAIPSFKKITGGGRFGLLFTPGDLDSLQAMLMKTSALQVTSFSQKVESYFKENLGFKSIAEELYAICLELARSGSYKDRTR
jgi:glycosyltransferase involved in cell wall biosynthesis